MAARTDTTPLTMAMMTPAMASITDMMHFPMPWKQDTTAPMFAVWLLFLLLLVVVVKGVLVNELSVES